MRYGFSRRSQRPRTRRLELLEDEVFRKNLRGDVSTAHSAMINGEWKAATVIASSVVETLLLWALQKKTPTDLKGALDNLISNRRLQSRPSGDLLGWSLHPLIEVALELKTVSDTTASQCRIAKDFRNLIHPGRAERLKIQCTRGTALSAVAAMEHVIADLAKP